MLESRVAVSRVQPIGAPGDHLTGVEFDPAHAQARQIGGRNAPRGGVVEAVDAGSPAARAGIAPGDVLLSINGRRLRDVIDYQFLTADETVLTCQVISAGEHRTMTLRRAEHETPGIAFTEPTFTPIRECNNHCPFCFIDQLPDTMRNSLYIRDDDYRYSFLFGNFVTLTNLNARDWERLEEQRLSPLYVSVHATDPAARALLLGNDRVPNIMEQLERLFTLNIRVHTQVVTCPGINDGEVLERTIRDLSSHFPHVLSIGVVPVGLTRTPAEILAGPAAHCSRILPSAADLPLRTFQPQEARAVVQQTRRWQREFRRLHDTSLVYASDEFYLLCDEPVPSAAAYDGYPQYENGIGMVRDVIDDWTRLRRRLARRPPSAQAPSVTLVCAEMIGTVLGNLTQEWGEATNVRAHLAVVRNEFFGPRVRVSGLLTGQDILANAHRFHGEVVVLPTVMLDKTGTRTLDDMSPAQLATTLGKPVHFAGCMSEVHAAVFEGSSVFPAAS